MEICFYIDLDQTRGGGRLQSDFGSISVVRFPDELLALQQAIDFRIQRIECRLNVTLFSPKA